MTKYMVIETFHPGCTAAAYQRFHEQGRLLPAGLVYLDSWLQHDGRRCFQLMETDEPRLFDQWVEAWEDLAAFEVIELGEKPGA